MRRAIWTGILAVSASLLIVMGILVTLFFHQIIDMFIYKEMIMRDGSETFEMWRKPPVRPQMKIYFFNLTNANEFMQGEKPKFREIGPYVYQEQWEKVNLTWHKNGSLSYVPTKKFFFDREASSGDDLDLVRTLNIPLFSAANSMKWGGKLTRLAMSSMLGVLNQEAVVVHTIRDLLWGYNDTLFKLAKDIMPPENVPPFDQFGLFVGKNGTGEGGTFTIYTGKESISTYARIQYWNGKNKLPFWKSDKCNKIYGTDGTAHPPDLSPNTTLYLFNPDLCRTVPLVYKKDVVHNGVEGYRFGPPTNLFDTPAQNPDNECFCIGGPPCVQQGLFNMSACKLDSPMAISWPHFLYGDPKLLEAVEGLSPNPTLHEFYMDLQPKLAVGLSAKARMQINLMLTRVDDIKQVAGITDMVFPIFWFESGIDSLPDQVTAKLKMVAELPETARAGISYSMFCLGSILFFCVAILIWKRMRNKSYGTDSMANGHVEFEKRSDTVTHSAKSSVRGRATEEPPCKDKLRNFLTEAETET